MLTHIRPVTQQTVRYIDDRWVVVTLTGIPAPGEIGTLCQTLEKMHGTATASAPPQLRIFDPDRVERGHQ